MSKPRNRSKRNAQAAAAQMLSDEHLAQELARAKAQQRAAAMRVNALEHEQRRRARTPQAAA